MVKGVANRQGMWEQNLTRFASCAIRVLRQEPSLLLPLQHSYTLLALYTPVSCLVQYIHIIACKGIIKGLKHGLNHAM
jgi:hypothetical protein